jgi:hypothetical protein
MQWTTARRPRSLTTPKGVNPPRRAIVFASTNATARSQCDVDCGADRKGETEFVRVPLQPAKRRGSGEAFVQRKVVRISRCKIIGRRKQRMEGRHRRLVYPAARKRELDQDQLSAPQYGKISWELKRLEKRFKDIVSAEITSTALTEYLEADIRGH